MDKIVLNFLIAIALVAVMPMAHEKNAYADDISTLYEEDEATRKILQVTPYLWAASLEGDISPFRRLPTVNTQKSFADVMEKLNFGGFLNIWGRQDNFVLSGDIMYVNTIDSRTVGPLPPLPGAPFGATIKGSVDTKQFMTALQAGYRVYNNTDFTIDALAGARFWHISNEVTVSSGNLSRSYGEDFHWLDPIVGTRIFFPINDTLSFQGQADIGGFGIGSKSTWSGHATVNYTLTDTIALSAGYKTLSVDYSNDGYTYDVRLSGPVMGATLRF